MNYFLFFIVIFYSFNNFAQTIDPNLFQTWYLDSYETSDADSSPTVIEKIVPAIKPSLTIREDLSFNGVGACNTFQGTFMSLGADTEDSITTDQFLRDTNVCEFESHQDFERDYVDYMASAYGFTIHAVDGGLELFFDTLVFGYYKFKNFTLNTANIETGGIDVYPNPTTNGLLDLKSTNNSIQKAELYDALGQKIKTIQYKLGRINISELDNGLYILRLETTSGMLTKKIIKN